MTWPISHFSDSPRTARWGRGWNKWSAAQWAKDIDFNAMQQLKLNLYSTYILMHLQWLEISLENEMYKNWRRRKKKMTTVSTAGAAFKLKVKSCIRCLCLNMNILFSTYLPFEKPFPAQRKGRFALRAELLIISNFFLTLKMLLKFSINHFKCHANLQLISNAVPKIK